jgi:hypothetical protein
MMPPLMSEHGEPAHCQAIFTVKGKRCCCDEPLTVALAKPEMSGHPAPGGCGPIATKL